ncbi:LEUCINE-RICH REPEAT EXTENSIN-LIKE PROTEIN 3-RELATED [Salix viminalis]|uniref:LEUCINE-RICH REPEAT EXTENSIN-LIKE PROTEIN 3-RELATED n=1 Tax=Salix viminalis TaxID=40686 RepID=A0A9Q0NTW2_SALVM|nr:LEUCINE-RICH REPEAT EXTENSIN-LIKE PROTEIN 3-RELATED [Salix viminalis]
MSTLVCVILTSLIATTLSSGATRETVEFLIGSGGRGLKNGCSSENHGKYRATQCSKLRVTRAPPPAPPVKKTELVVFSDQRLASVYPIIQKFKSLITSDPLGITKTWVGSDICSYKGFFCDSPPDNKSATAVASVDFNGFHLAAPTLDGFLDQLPDVALFHANSNSFSGTISPNIARLPYLYELDISNNLFSVPPQIFTQNLDVLFINNNNFMTTLPDNLGNTHIRYLTLANNKFTGPIPSDIFKVFSSLSEVLLLNNQITGCLPYEVGLLKEATVFDAGNNRLTGPLPFALSCLEKVEQLNFAGNQLFGMVPEVACELVKLTNFLTVR